MITKEYRCGKSFILIVMICLFIPMVGGCRRDRARRSSSTSTVELYKALPNLKGLSIESCNYTVSWKTEISILPSPSDTKVMLLGVAVLYANEPSGLEFYKDWTPISRKEVPEDLRNIIPEGTIKYSPSLNDSFNKNPAFMHGFIVVANDQIRTAYIISTDMDHPVSIGK